MIRVLVVDDDPHLRRLVLFALRLDPELEATACDSGETAIAEITAAPDALPAIVLLDLELPGMGGREIAARIATLAPDAAIVFVTGAENVDASAVRGLIKKPFDPLALAGEVRRIAGAHSDAR